MHYCPTYQRHNIQHYTLLHHRYQLHCKLPHLILPHSSIISTGWQRSCNHTALSTPPPHAYQLCTRVPTGVIYQPHYGRHTTALCTHRTYPQVHTALCTTHIVVVQHHIINTHSPLLALSTPSHAALYSGTCITSEAARKRNKDTDNFLVTVGKTG
jgi:hypothetical protein